MDNQLTTQTRVHYGVTSFINRLIADITALKGKEKFPEFKYKPFYEVSMDITEMADYTPTVGELVKVNKEVVKLKVMEIMARHLSTNIKTKGITSERSIHQVIDFILVRCKNLEIQEVDFIFMNGVLGQYGTIYNDISIDTICGIDGWIESYYKQDRWKRPDPGINTDEIYYCKKDQKYKPIYSGNEITADQFFDLFPGAAEIKRIVDSAKAGRLTSDEVKQFYKVKGMTINDYQDDYEAYVYNFNYLKQRAAELENKLGYNYESELSNEVSDEQIMSLMELRQEEIKTAKKLAKIKDTVSLGESHYVRMMQRKFILDNYDKSLAPNE